MLSRRAVLSLIGVAVLLSTLGATPAFCQTADLEVTLATPDPSEMQPFLISFGGTRTYRVTIKNLGPSQAVAPQLTATIPPQTTLTSIGASCQSINSDGKFPCRLANIVDGSTATATFTVTLPAPDPIPTTCPNPNAIGSTSVTVTSTTPDPNPANNTATVTNRTRPFADRAVTMSGPATANQGDTVSYNVVVSNNGPCDATNVRVRTGVGRTGAGLTFQSNSGDCTTGAPSDDPTEPDLLNAFLRCPAGARAAGWALTVGASRAFTTMFTVDKLPKDITFATLVNTVTSTSSTDDLITANNAATVRTNVANNVGCSSTGGDGSAAGLIIGVLAFAITRRRIA